MCASTVQLYCFPYAGSSAITVYAKWCDLLPSWIDIHPVEFPGRGQRINEPLLYSMSDLTKKLADEIIVKLVSPYILLGHSLGALVAFEVAQLLQHSKIPPPDLLCISGRDAPTNKQKFCNPPKLRTDEELLSEMCELGGTLPEIFNNPEILRLILPIIRADFYISESYRYQSESLLDCPIQVFGGIDDNTTTFEALMRWKEKTSHKCKIDFLEGGHFFIQDQNTDFLELLESCISNELCNRISDNFVN